MYFEVAIIITVTARSIELPKTLQLPKTPYNIQKTPLKLKK